MGLDQIDNAAVFRFEAKTTSRIAAKMMPADVAERAGSVVPFRVRVQFVTNPHTTRDAAGRPRLTQPRVACELFGAPFYTDTRKLNQEARESAKRKRKAGA